MPLTLTDEDLRAMHMDEHDARAEIACRLFDAGKLGKSRAARLAGLSRDEFDAQLVARGLPVIRIDEAYVAQERAAIESWDEGTAR